MATALIPWAIAGVAQLPLAIQQMVGMAVAVRLQVAQCPAAPSPMSPIPLSEVAAAGGLGVLELSDEMMILRSGSCNDCRTRGGA